MVRDYILTMVLGRNGIGFNVNHHFTKTIFIQNLITILITPLITYHTEQPLTSSPFSHFNNNHATLTFSFSMNKQ